MTTTAAPPKERPILFSGPMIRAILAGRKTQTRRVMKPQANPIPFEAPCPPNPGAVYDSGWFLGEPAPQYVIDLCPYGKIGERLWVREAAYIAPATHFSPRDGNLVDKDGHRRVVDYAATMDGDSVEIAVGYGVKKSPSIHMPRWASRILLDVTGVRVERLDDITAADAQAEGADRECAPEDADFDDEGDGYFPPMSHTIGFANLWERINGKGAWAANPWVWVVEFKVRASSPDTKGGAQ